MIQPYIPDATKPFSYRLAGHLLRRTMVGPTHEEIIDVEQKGLDATIDSLCNNHTQSVWYIDEWADKDPEVLRPVSDEDYVGWFWANVRRVRMFYHWWLQNIITSPLSLQERLVLFWHNHFATNIRVNIEFAAHIYTQYRLLQRMSMGNFKEFVKLMLRDVALQLNLSLHNNYVHDGTLFINENFARELMELHTCGKVDKDGNALYTQKDVYEAARALTGWFTAPSSLGHGYRSRFTRFIDNRWDNSDKTFLGETGKWNSDDIIDILFEKRQYHIAYRLCHKLCAFFITDNPDKEYVHDLAMLFIENNWEIAPIIRTMLHSKYFFDEENIGVLKKSHIEYITGMIRQLGLTNIPDFEKEQTHYGDIIERLEEWGQVMYNPPNVSGWVGGRDWVNSSVFPRRLQFAKDIVHNRLLTFSHPFPPYIYTCNIRALAARFSSAEIPSKLCLDLAQYLLPDAIHNAEQQQLITAILDGGSDADWDYDDEKMRVEQRIAKCLDSIVSHASFQLQ
jgi:uncharacterized protein (DUF1800 family)